VLAQRGKELCELMRIPHLVRLCADQDTQDPEITAAAQADELENRLCEGPMDDCNSGARTHHSRHLP